MLAWVALLGACNGGDGDGDGIQPGPPIPSGFAIDTPFDFNDAYYELNGIDPDQLNNRVQPEDENSTLSQSDDPTRNTTRILEINGGYDAAGALLYYPAPPAFFPREAFLENSAGEKARQLADQFRAFIFPKRDGSPLSPAPPNRRHDNVFDTSSGYSTVNPLGLWRITFPRFTDAAINSPEGQEMIAELAARNGTDLDGTCVIKRLSEILELEALGFLELRQRPEDGSEGDPWVV